MRKYYFVIITDSNFLESGVIKWPSCPIDAQLVIE